MHRHEATSAAFSDRYPGQTQRRTASSYVWRLSAADLGAGGRGVANPAIPTDQREFFESIAILVFSLWEGVGRGGRLATAGDASST